MLDIVIVLSPSVDPLWFLYFLEVCVAGVDATVHINSQVIGFAKGRYA